MKRDRLIKTNKPCSGFAGSWSRRSNAVAAIHCLKGSAFGDGTDCMIRKSCSVSATSVRRIFPSAARSFKVLQIVVGSCPSFFIRDFNTLQYRLGSGLSVRMATTSIIEKYHFPCSSSHTARTFLSSRGFLIWNKKRHAPYTLQIGGKISPLYREIFTPPDRSPFL